MTARILVHVHRGFLKAQTDFSRSKYIFLTRICCPQHNADRDSPKYLGQSEFPAEALDPSIEVHRVNGHNMQRGIHSTTALIVEKLNHDIDRTNLCQQDIDWSKWQNAQRSSSVDLFAPTTPVAHYLRLCCWAIGPKDFLLSSDCILSQAQRASVVQYLRRIGTSDIRETVNCGCSLYNDASKHDIRTTTLSPPSLVEELLLKCFVLRQIRTLQSWHHTSSVSFYVLHTTYNTCVCIKAVSEILILHD